MSTVERNTSPSTTKEQVSAPLVAAPPRAAVSWRALLIGSILIPINCFWIIQMEIIKYVDFPTTISLFFNVIFTLLVLIVLNIALRRFLPRWALTQPEMLVVYVMLMLASALCGHDMIQILGSMMGHVAWFATPENKWDMLFGKYLPSWLLVRDKEVLRGFYQGDSSLYTLQNLRGWMAPVLAWCGFIMVLLFIMLCMNTLLRKQWAERERLSYPLIALPIEMTDPSMSLFKNKLMWIGFALAAFIDIMNGLNALYPNLPAVTAMKVNLGTSFPERPWNSLNPIWFGVYPFAIGLGVLLPLDLSFSCWFFYFFWKMQYVISSSTGWNEIPMFPYVNQQACGAYLGLALFALYTSRKALWEVLKKAVGAQSDASDEGEAMSYRTALIGTLAGMALLVWFCLAMGMSLWVALGFLVIYFLLSLAITRMRAELGPPAHDLHQGGPDQVMVAILGTENMGVRNLTGMSILWWFNRAYRSHPMPIQLESYKIAERQNMGYRRIAVAMMLAAGLGALCSFWAFLHLNYIRGAATARVLGPITWAFGPEPYNMLSGWIQTPKPSNVPGSTAIGVGILFTLLLQFLRMRFVWFPFHPVGYAVSSSWALGYLWAPLFTAWLVKLLILRYGGLKAFQKSVPFFLGLILGEYVTGSVWAIIGILFDVKTYSFWG